jgi:hypothetical protein
VHQAARHVFQGQEVSDVAAHWLLVGFKSPCVCKETAVHASNAVSPVSTNT